jgi:hypothetical protein
MFFYDKNDRVLSQEISTLECNGYKMSSMVAIESHTGNTVTFHMKKEHRTNDVDREVTHWSFAPTSMSMVEVPECAGVELLIWND